MANFKYKARDKFARLASGTIVAESKDEAAKILKEMGYIPVFLDEAHQLRTENILNRFKRINLIEINTFTRQLLSLQKAGLPLLSSLEAIALQTKNRYFRLVIEEIGSDIKGGLSFSAALRKHSSIFDEIYINMVKAGEASGRLVEILERLTGLVEQEIDTRSRINAATRYPMVAFFVLCLGFLIVVTFVIPRFAFVYGQFNTVLPLPTRIMIAINLTIQKYWFLFILGLALGILAFLRFINTKIGRPIWDNFKLNIPILGQLLSMLIMSRFARVTAILMNSGVPILEILSLTASASGNIIISRAIENIKQSVNQGKGMSEPMKISNLFPPVVIQMVSIGEQSGRVDELLLGVADYYDRESGYIIRNLTTYIEPILILFLAIMVLLMALGIFLPMWNLIRVFKPA